MESQKPVGVELERKYEALREALGGMGSVAVAFSGGVDSTLVLKVAHDVLGEGVLAVTGKSPSIPAREIEEARLFCEQHGIRHSVVETHEFEIEGFDRNPPDRCYHCKRELISCIRAEAASRGIDVVVEGSNLDDDGDYRPGSKAVSEMGVKSPLRDAGMTKDDVRALARHLGLAVWDKPAYACLNTRFAYGDELTRARLEMVDCAEEVMRGLGFASVRVRMRDETARIEVPASDIARLAAPETRGIVVKELKALGFAYVSLDLEGYRTGSMNETL